MTASTITTPVIGRLGGPIHREWPRHSFGGKMRLDTTVRTSEELTGPFRPAGILFQVTRNVAKSLGLTGQMGADINTRSILPCLMT